MDKFIVFHCSFPAAITVFNLNLSQQDAAGDITLAGVEMVAGAWIELDDDNELKYCWTNHTMGGLFSITPCAEYNANYLPPYRCGTPIPFCWAGGQQQQCVDQWKDPILVPLY